MERGSPPTACSYTSGRGRGSSLRIRRPLTVPSDMDYTSWVSLDSMSRSSIFLEHDTSPLSNLHLLVGLAPNEEWDILGVPFGELVCSPVDGLGFYIHSTMLMEVGASAIYPL